MKYQIVFLIGVLHLLTSCSNEVEENLIPEFKLPTERIRISIDEGNSKNIYKYIYDEKYRLVETQNTYTRESPSLSQVNLRKYLYEGDKIKEIDYFYGEENDLRDKLIFEYEANQIVKKTYYYRNRIDHVYNYEYNTDNIQTKEISISYENDGTPSPPFVTFFEYSNESKTVKGLKENNDTYIYEYDNYNSPFSNVPSYTIGVDNNRLSYKYYNEQGNLNETVSTNYINSYDNDGFLVNQERIKDGRTVSIEFRYNK